jgi:hypothetical protein
MMTRWAAAALLLAAGVTATPALAHVTASPGQAPAGGHAVVGFRIGHGCQGSATTALRIEIGADIASAKAQPKPGWTIEAESAAGADGKPRVSAIIWRGRLPDDQFDDFNLLLALAKTPGPLYFPAVQTCEAGEARWTQIPAEPEMTGLERPAPSVTLTASEAPPEHHH